MDIQDVVLVVVYDIPMSCIRYAGYSVPKEAVSIETIAAIAFGFFVNKAAKTGTIIPETINE